MLATHLTQLRQPPAEGVDRAWELVDGFDDALVVGLARLGEEQSAALDGLAAALDTSPLRDQVGEAVHQVVAGAVTTRHLVVLAGARTALLGAVHDELLGRLDAALGRDREELGPQPDAGEAATAGEAGAENLLSACRAWLTELAVAGWRGVNHDLVSGSAPVIQGLLAEPGLRRLAVLLDGLADELRACCPVATMEGIPARRWADLWSRAMLLAHSGGWAGAATAVSGRLLILGVDVHEHATAVRFQIHGVLEPAGGGPSRQVRTSVAVAKVDTIVGPALWRLMGGYPVLLRALAERRAVEVTDVALLDSGDLVWQEERATVGEPVDLFAVARVCSAGMRAPAVPPLDRHPAGIAEPVLVEGYTTSVGDDGAVTADLDGQTLMVDVTRLSDCGPLTPQLVAASSACVGLLRWDAEGWSLQPLAVRATVKRKPVTAYTGDWALGPTDPKVAKAELAAGDVVSVLRERAGRLLRR